MAESFTFYVTEDMEGIRIDKCLIGFLESLSRTYIQKLIGDGQVLVGEKCIKSNYRVKAGDILHISVPEATEPDILPENIPLRILYEDADLLVVNKPKGMVVHPAAGHYSGTLVNALLYYCKDSLSGIGGILRPGIVHRIDKDTTGSLLVCKNDAAHAAIASQLQAHTIKRRYVAIVHGILKEDTGTVNAPVGRDTTDRKRMAVDWKCGKEAITHYHVLKRFPGQGEGYTYVACELETGRTHQIRVHMTSIGHPLLGDTVYAPGRKNKYNLEGQTLHAKILGFVRPSDGAYIETEAPLPEYFEHLLKIL